MHFFEADVGVSGELPDATDSLEAEESRIAVVAAHSLCVDCGLLMAFCPRRNGHAQQPIGKPVASNDQILAGPFQNHGPIKQRQAPQGVSAATVSDGHGKVAAASGPAVFAWGAPMRAAANFDFGFRMRFQLWTDAGDDNLPEAGIVFGVELFLDFRVDERGRLYPF